MGDVFHTFPALSDAMQRIPNLQVDWVVEKDFAEIPTWHPAVKTVWPIELRAWRKHPFRSRKAIRTFFQAINEQQYDLVIDAQGLLKSAWVVRKINANVKAGLDWSSAREPLASLFYTRKIKVDKQQHAIWRLRELFAKVLGYPLNKAQEEEHIQYGLATDSWQPLANIQQPYAVFLHGTTWPTKYWPEEHWVLLAEQLQQQYEGRLTIVYPWGNAEEKARSERLKGKNRQGWVPENKMSLNEVAICLKYASFVVSVDTGLSHVAAALDVPMVVLYRVTDPKKVGAKGNKVTQLASPLAQDYIKEFTSKEQKKQSLQCLSVAAVYRLLCK